MTHVCHIIKACHPCIGHIPAISVEYHGALVLRYSDGPCSPPDILVASPCVTFGDELLDDILNSDSPLYPEMRLERRPEVSHRGHFTNYLLHIDGKDRHVVYRIGNYVKNKNSWQAAWPD